MSCKLPYYNKCCFCMPLRKGVLAFGYLNIIISVYILGLCCYTLIFDTSVELLYRKAPTRSEADLCIVIACSDILFNLLLVYGAHKQIVIYLKVFYYYTISLVVVLIIMEIISFIILRTIYDIELFICLIIEQCVKIYVLLLVRSLMHKIKNSRNACENQLLQIVDGELEVEGDGKKSNTAVPIESA